MTLRLPHLFQLVPFPSQHVPPLVNLPHGLSLRLANFLEDSRSHHPTLDTDALLAPLLHLPADSLLDRQHKLHIPLSDQRDGFTAAARTRRTTDTVHVVVRVAGHIVVDDQADGGDVETTRGDVRGNEDAGRGGAEAGEVGVTLGLRQETVQGGDAVGEAAEHALEQVGRLGVVAEDDGGSGGVAFGGEEDVQEGFAVRQRHLEVGLFERGGDGALILRGDLGNEDGRLVGGSGHVLQGADFGGYCRGEEESLPLAGGRQCGEARFDVGEHAARPAGE